MSTKTRSRNRWLRYGGIAIAAIVVLAGMHFAINGNLIGWIAAIHGQ